MAAPRGAIRNWAEYVVVLAVDGMAALLPPRVFLGLMRGLSRFSRHVLRRRIRTAAQRISTCLGLKADDPRVDEIVIGAFETLVLNAVEPMVVERLLERGRLPEAFLTGIEGREHLDRAFRGDRPVLFCTGHIGSWELIPLFASRLYAPIWAMARPLGNPLLERYLASRRLRCVRGTVSKDGGGLKVARIMRAREPLGLLLDQNAGSGGVILDFLGLPSSHHTVAGVMAQRFGALAVPDDLLREEQPLRYRLLVEPPIEADPALPAAEAELDVIVRLSRSMEDMVRAHPEQWLWLHDRWRHALRVTGRSADGSASSRAEHTQLPVAQGTNGG